MHYDVFINCTNLIVVYYAKVMTLHILYFNVFVLYAAMSSTVSKGIALQCSYPIKAVLTVLKCTEMVIMNPAGFISDES